MPGSAVPCWILRLLNDRVANAKRLSAMPATADGRAASVLVIVGPHRMVEISQRPENRHAGQHEPSGDSRRRFSRIGIHRLYVLRRVWDAPTRLFHWAVVVLVVALWLTQYEGWMPQHMLCGYAMMALLLFRLAWGVVGSDTALFRRFLKSPLAAFRHVKHLHRRPADTEIGHNAAGGWMVLLMLLLLCVQVATGLCANDEISTQGPLADTVGPDASDWLSHIHAINFTLIEIAISLHVLAILIYRLLGYRLAWPMITGRKSLPDAVPPPRMASPWLAAGLLCAAAAVVWFVVAHFSD
jgi:cytochrome b